MLTLDVVEDLLYICKVSIAIDDTFNAKIGHFQPGYDCRLLPIAELPDWFFHNLNYDLEVHIVIQPPD